MIPDRAIIDKQRCGGDVGLMVRQVALVHQPSRRGRNYRGVPDRAGQHDREHDHQSQNRQDQFAVHVLTGTH